MDTARPSRPIPLLLTALVAFFSALAALAVSNGMAHAHGVTPHSHHTHAALPALTKKAVLLHDDMRKLWEDHITWTRMAIVSLELGLPDANAAVARLLRNQTDIGNAFKPFYGEAAGEKVTGLLRQHILVAADLIAAAKAGDNAKLADAQVRWVANADQIAAALHSLNPHYWPLAKMKAEMHMHLTLTTEEAVARLHDDWNADVAAYDKVHQHILHMSDLLADGLVKQFPKRFR
jgi:hypothetical protein